MFPLSLYSRYVNKDYVVTSKYGEFNLLTKSKPYPLLIRAISQAL